MTKAARTARFNREFARTFCAASAAPEYRTDGKGRKVRVFTQDNPLTRDQVRFFYLNKRGFDEEECLEALGYNGFRTQVQSGNLVKCGLFYMVSTRAAKNYDLPRPVVGGAVCDFVEV